MKRFFYALAIICLIAPAVHAEITSVVPNSAAQGDNLWVTISGSATMFGQGTSTIVTFEQGSFTTYTITASTVNVSSTTELAAHFSIPSGAPLGYYDVKVTEQFVGTYTLTDGFRVVEPTSCGDVNGDASINVADATYLANYVFLGGPPPADFSVGDVNCDGKIDLLDISIILGYIFRGGASPCSMCP